MEEYEGIENDASDATATTTTPGGQVHEVLSQAEIRHEVVRGGTQGFSKRRVGTRRKG